MCSVPGLKCHHQHVDIAWSPQVNVTAWPGLVSAAPWMGGCQLQDIANNEWDYPGGEQLPELGLLDHSLAGASNFLSSQCLMFLMIPSLGESPTCPSLFTSLLEISKFSSV